MKHAIIFGLSLGLWACAESGAPNSASGHTDLLSAENAQKWHSVGTDALSPQWSIKDGVLSLSAAGGGDVTNGQVYGEFDLILEWKISEAGNSGIFYLAHPDTAAHPVWTSAFEMQILDDERHSDNKTAFTRAGAVYALYPAIDGTAKPAGEWNLARIRVEGGTVTHWLNGQEIVSYRLGSADLNQRIADSKFAQFERVFGQSPAGLIVLQDHQDPVSFRNIRIKELGD